MTNDRESRAPGKREPGNEFPSWFLEGKTEKRGCNAAKKCFGSKCAPFGVILPRGGGVKYSTFYPKTIFNGPIKTIILMGVNRNRVNDSSVKVAY